MLGFEKQEDRGYCSPLTPARRQDEAATVLRLGKAVDKEGCKLWSVLIEIASLPLGKCSA